MTGNSLGASRTMVALTILALCSAGSASASENEGALARTQVGPAAEPSVTILPPRQVQSVLGKEVRSSANENMGRMVDVIVDRSGRVRAAIIDFGGFLGVGSRKIAVEWSALHFDPDSSKREVITLELTRDQVKEAPEYKDKKSVVVLGASGGLLPLPMD
jgi:PRC-barrel domain protein